MTRHLRLMTAPVLDPPNRGRLMTAEQVATELFPPGTTPRYVRDRVYPRVVLSRRSIFWYEADVRSWIDQQRVETQS